MVPGAPAKASHSRQRKKWLATPTGWARANILFEKAERPKPGSLQESLIIAVWRRRREIQFLLSKASLLATKDLEAADKLFNEARELEFPTTGDLRALMGDEKKAVEFLKSMTKMAFRVKTDPRLEMGRLRSRLMDQTRQNEARPKGRTWKLKED